ncbi:unnamed protein product [Rhodiola kirilowii]
MHFTRWEAVLLSTYPTVSCMLFSVIVSRDSMLMQLRVSMLILRVVEDFAEERFHSTRLSEIYKDGSFQECLIEARQLINLLLSSQPENFMNHVIRQKNYYTLDYKKVASIIEKYKDSADGIFGSLSNRNTKQSSKKKSMDMLKKRLKDFN